MRSWVLVAMLALALAACGRAPAPSRQPEATNGPPASRQTAAVAHASASAEAGGARSVKESNNLYEFEYAYPVAAGRIPELKAWLDADLAKQRKEFVDQAREDKASSKEAGIEFHPYALAYDWKVVADLPDWLSLSTMVYSDEGGAHPNHGYSALLWDKRANLQRQATDLFASKQAFTQATQAAFCAEIDKQREKKRGEPIKRDSDSFTDCLDPAKETVILGSSNHKTFDRIGFLVGPYEAGPYVEGDYEVTLPVTATILAAVKPEFRGAFSVRR